MTKDEFASALRRTVDELAHAASVASVTLPPKYSFSFEAERSLTLFAPGSLAPLSVQLGEVKALCAVLYQAKVNSLDNLRRERVSADDARGPQSDYLEQISVTNSLAVMSPYEVGFHCFSSELAAVLADLANDPHGVGGSMAGAGIGAGGRAVAGRGEPQSAHRGDAGAGPMPMYQPAPSPGSPPGQKGGLPVMVDEKPLKVTLVLELIKLPPKN